MKFSKVFSMQPQYAGAELVHVEIDIARGLHAFSIVGMASKAVDESRDRVSSALRNSGYESPKSKNEKLVISLAPAELKKDGAFHDVAIAIGYLSSSERLSASLDGKVFLGELALDGSVRRLNGILPMVQEAKKQGFQEVFVPLENEEEAALVNGITVYAVPSLSVLVRHLDIDHPEHKNIEPTKESKIKKVPYTGIDMSDIKGQELVKRGLEIAAAGGHNVALYGPPGTGKTMLARAFAGILPPLTKEEMLEVTGIHSIAGVLGDKRIITTAPVRSPHHTSSYVALIGGGSRPKPGEVTLAHHGVLFLDEFPEFDKKVLEALRQPLEDRVVTIARAQGTVVFPASFILFAAMNPCPCGFAGAKHKTCSCSAHEIQRYMKKVSGPMMDRIDMWLPVDHIDYKELHGNSNTPKTSPVIQKRVTMARACRKENGDKKVNAKLSSREVGALELTDSARQVLEKSAKALFLSPRSYHRVIKLARTIADLSASDLIGDEHILEALQYRPKNN